IVSFPAISLPCASMNVWSSLILAAIFSRSWELIAAAKSVMAFMHDGNRERCYPNSLILPPASPFELHCETFAAGTVRNCVWIGALEAAFLQVFDVIEHRATDEKRALWIDNQPHV